MMKAPLHYASGAVITRHYRPPHTNPGPALSLAQTIRAVNIHVIASHQLSGKMRSVITAVEMKEQGLLVCHFPLFHNNYRSKEQRRRREQGCF